MHVFLWITLYEFIFNLWWKMLLNVELTMYRFWRENRFYHLSCKKNELLKSVLHKISVEKLFDERIGLKSSELTILCFYLWKMTICGIMFFQEDFMTVLATDKYGLGQPIQKIITKWKINLSPTSLSPWVSVFFILWLSGAWKLFEAEEYWLWFKQPE